MSTQLNFYVQTPTDSQALQGTLTFAQAGTFMFIWANSGEQYVDRILLQFESGYSLITDVGIIRFMEDRSYAKVYFFEGTMTPHNIVFFFDPADPSKRSDEVRTSDETKPTPIDNGLTLTHLLEVSSVNVKFSNNQGFKYGFKPKYRLGLRKNRFGIFWNLVIPGKPNSKNGHAYYDLTEKIERFFF